MTGIAFAKIMSLPTAQFENAPAVTRQDQLGFHFFTVVHASQQHFSLFFLFLTTDRHVLLFLSILVGINRCRRTSAIFLSVPGEKKKEKAIKAAVNSEQLLRER